MYWNFDVEQSKKTQSNKENKNVKEDERKAICFITTFFSSGTERRQNVPIKGNIIKNDSILIDYNFVIVY
jgi:hypothetical protein